MKKKWWMAATGVAAIGMTLSSLICYLRKRAQVMEWSY